MGNKRTNLIKYATQDFEVKNYFGNVERIPDILGIEKRDFGAYYTDEQIANYILDHLDIRPGSYVLDPSCGCGSFVFPLYYRILKNRKKRLDGLYGVDIDNKAVEYTINTILKMSRGLNREEVLGHIINRDFIFKQRDLVDGTDIWQEKLTEILQEGGFDFIVGNPPFNLNNHKKMKPVLSKAIHREIAKEHGNIPIYFILRGLELLKKGGTLAFVLPKTLLYVGKYHDFRSYILNNFSILKITEIGIKFKGVRGEQIVLFIKNEKPTANSAIVFTNLTKEGSQGACRPFKVPQSYFSIMDGIPTMPNELAYQLVRKLKEKSVQILDFREIDVCRGVSLGKARLETIPYEGDRVIPTNAFIKGKDISKLHLKSLTIVEEHLYKSSELSRIKKPKIILQNIYSSESGLISYLDKQCLPTTETVTNIIMADRRKLAYVHALLNSKLINFYLSQVVFSRSRLTMHLDRYYLRQLPLLWDPSREETTKLVTLGEQSVYTNPDDVKYTLKEIDKLVYRLYGINDHGRLAVEDIMSKTLSHKSLW
jgi:tRNA1(Val) A37 N6-methylase TrmN6